MIYDSFTITAAITAEMLGLAPRGKGHTLWQEGHAAPGGRLPINTNGGGLSFNHSGMYGMQTAGRSLPAAFRYGGGRCQRHSRETNQRPYLCGQWHRRHVVDEPAPWCWAADS